ncbi:MAG: DUF6088 family protein [Pirellulaceae bacterium]
MSQTIADKALTKIYGNGRGWSFSQVDFANLGGRDALDKALERLALKGTIRRVIRGIYDYPRYSELLDQELGPDIYQVANALARKFGWRIHPDGASSLNLMGISTQVPARYIFQSDGPNREYEIGKTSLQFVQKPTKEMNFKYDESAVIVHGLKSLGDANIDETVIAKVREWLPVNKRDKVLRDTARVTGWVYEAIQKICEDRTDG